MKNVVRNDLLSAVCQKFNKAILRRRSMQQEKYTFLHFRTIGPNESLVDLQKKVQILEVCLKLISEEDSQWEHVAAGMSDEYRICRREARRENERLRKRGW